MLVFVAPCLPNVLPPRIGEPLSGLARTPLQSLPPNLFSRLDDSASYSFDIGDNYPVPCLPGHKEAVLPAFVGDEQRYCERDPAVGLAAFFAATGGAAGAWTEDAGWSADPTAPGMVNPCSGNAGSPIAGVTCGGGVLSGYVVELSLPSNGLVGWLEWSALSGLTALAVLDLSSNSLRGEIDATSLFQFASLERLDLSGNADISGPLPPEIDQLTALRAIDVSSTGIEGPLPWDALAALTELRTFIVRDTLMSGPLADDALSSAQAATALKLANLDLDASFIPSQLPSSLRTVELTSLGLKGRIPEYLGASMSGLATVTLRDNDLEGPLPATLLSHPEVSVLDVSENADVNIWPSGAALGAKVETLDLGGTGITVLPAGAFDGASLLASLTLPTFPDPCPAGQVEGIVTLIGDGAAEVRYCALDQAAGLAAFFSATGGAAGNWAAGADVGWSSDPGVMAGACSGTPPIGITCGTGATSDRVTKLQLSGTGLVGPIPLSALQNLEDLEILDLGANAGLTGEVTFELGQLARLTELHLKSCSLFGNLDWVALGSLVRLTKLSLEHNAFTGTIAARHLTRLVELASLDLGGQDFDGDIDFDWSPLAKLQVLRVGDNQLTGTLPGSLGSLAQLQYLTLTGTCVSGGAVDVSTVRYCR